MAKGGRNKRTRSAPPQERTRGSTAAFAQLQEWLQRHPLLRLATVAAVCIAAHVGCLWSTFYMDDWPQITNSPLIESGRWWTSGLNVVTTLSYWLTWRVAGYSAPAFHAGNLLLHLALSIAIAQTASVFFEGTQQHGDSSEAAKTARAIAWLAALVFAAHPLTTEITNYARARDHGFVALFSYLTAVAGLRWIRDGWRWAPALVLCAAAATFSKGPGLGHVAVNLSLVWLFFSRPADWKARFPTYREILAAAVVIVAGAIAVVQSGDWFPIIRDKIQDPRLGWHTLTQMRVIWQYVGLLLWPGPLCSDHLVAWTRSLADLTAWAGAAAILGTIGGIVVAARAGDQRIAFLFAVVLGTLLLRCTYVVSELMVEYRVYPALPWFAMIVGWGLLVASKRWGAPAIVGTAALLAAFVIRSEFRAADWRNTDSLAASILRIYPWQLRAYVELGNARRREGDFKAVEKLYAEFSPKLAAVLRENAKPTPRVYADWGLWAVCFDAIRIDARTQTDGPAVGRALLEQLKRRMEAAGITQGFLRSQWHWAAAIVAEAEGDMETARTEFALAERLR